MAGSRTATVKLKATSVCGEPFDADRFDQEQLNNPDAESTKEMAFLLLYSVRASKPGLL